MGSNERYDETFTRASVFFRIVADTEGDRKVCLTFHAPHFSLVEQEDGQRSAEIVLTPYEAKVLGLRMRDAGGSAIIPPEHMAEHLRQRREQEAMADRMRRALGLESFDHNKDDIRGPENDPLGPEDDPDEEVTCTKDSEGRDVCAYDLTGCGEDMCDHCPLREGGPPYDAATAIGMYDRDDG